MSRADYARDVHRYAFKPREYRKVISNGPAAIWTCDHMGSWPNARDNDAVGSSQLLVPLSCT